MQTITCSNCFLNNRVHGIRSVKVTFAVLSCGSFHRSTNVRAASQHVTSISSLILCWSSIITGGFSAERMDWSRVLGNEPSWAHWCPFSQHRKLCEHFFSRLCLITGRSANDHGGSFDPVSLCDSSVSCVSWFWCACGLSHSLSVTVFMLLQRSGLRWRSCVVLYILP